ncbi:RNA-guided endonuclease InsQ/TnpB family protein [Pseudarthrobacter albicanus]|uniref:RNA-guided endonuclease InsQ/TnpB family protein n=1 Tax=Pseudarthrobacter albicanus TaxID=2823873 RepID=UPI001FE894CE|nr:transposase [Pseudarthrobacter albicanus]
MAVPNGMPALANIIVFLHDTNYSVSVSLKKRYAYRAYPSKGQERALARLFGSCRVVFNDVLAARSQAHEQGLPFPTSGELSKKLLTDAKRTPERAWLTEVSSVPLQQSLADADRAYRNFFDSLKKKRKGAKIGRPRFKSRRDNRQAARFTKNAGFKVEQTSHGVGFATLPKVGRVRFALSRDLPSKPSSVSVIRQADGTYQVSFVVDVAETPLPESPRVAGVDVGLTHLAHIASNDGAREVVDNPRHLRATERRLAAAQRSLSRKKKDSANRRKARLNVAKLHSTVRNTRLDHHHKLALRLVRENQTVAVEGLNVKGLARTRMAKSIHDAGWATLVTLLKEKAAQYGREIRVISQWEPTSQVCSVCGVKDGKKPLSVRVWTCGDCGTVLDRDYNAAVNIMLATGLVESLNACGPDVRRTLACATGVEARTHRTDPTLIGEDA